MNSTSSSQVRPALRLEGVRLNDRWLVVERFKQSPNATGGRFSFGYIAADQSGKQFSLKAMDYWAAKFHPKEELSTRLYQMTAAINFERDVLALCQDKKIRRAVVAVDTGTYQFIQGDIHSTVEYLVFELADGDVRKHLHAVDNVTLRWTLDALHSIASCLESLHQTGVAHQDLKPSNILVFDESKHKVADFGRAICKTLNSPYAGATIVGDRTYAPPELLYGEISPNWNSRYLACDAYLFGSLIVYLFTHLCMNELLFAEIPDDLHYRRWSGSYENVLPHVVHAFVLTIPNIAVDVPELVREDVIRSIQELCHPDPSKRGHPLSLREMGNQYSLRRYVSLFNRLAKRAGI